MNPKSPTSPVPSISLGAVRAAFHRARFAEEAHGAALRMLTGLEPRAPMWAREAVQKAHAAMVEANQEEDRILADAVGGDS